MAVKMKGNMMAERYLGKSNQEDLAIQDDRQKKDAFI